MDVLESAPREEGMVSSGSELSVELPPSTGEQETERLTGNGGD